jgi:hypothetical protein
LSNLIDLSLIAVVTKVQLEETRKKKIEIEDEVATAMLNKGKVQYEVSNGRT